MNAIAYEPHILHVPLHGTPFCTKPWEVQWMLDKLRLMRGHIVEVGTFQGETAFEFASAYPDRLVYCFDLPDKDIERCYTDHMRGKPCCHLARHLPNVKVKQTTDWQIPSPEGGLQTSFVFIDGDHSWDGVKRDTEKAFAWFRPSGTYADTTNARHGTVVWHDFYWHPELNSQVYTYLFYGVGQRGWPITHVLSTGLAFCDF